MKNLAQSVKTVNVFVSRDLRKKSYLNIKVSFVFSGILI